MGLINAPNMVPERQRYYQAAYKAHTRIWRINPRSKFLLVPFYITTGASTFFSLYGMGRFVAGYKTLWND